MNEIVIPKSLHVVCDDLGWFCGKDDRAAGGPSRTGMPRRHNYLDYMATGELGRYIDAEITCAFVLGEWDPDNRLSSIPHLSKYGKEWNNAAFIDKEDLKKCVAAINNSPYMNIAIHGLLHGNYRDGVDSTDTSDYYYNKNNELIMVEEDEIRARLDAFFDLLSYHGINKKITAFVPPSFAYRTDELSRILADYGILYASTMFSIIEHKGDEPHCAIADNGIIVLDRDNNPFPWNTAGTDPTELPVTDGVIGLHWPNILDNEPSAYPRAMSAWAQYLRRCSDTFGIILPRTFAAAATHSLYQRYSKLEKTERGVKIDLTNIPDVNGNIGEFYISSREHIKGCTGATVEFYQMKGAFMNFKVTPTEKIIEIW